MADETQYSGINVQIADMDFNTKKRDTGMREKLWNEDTRGKQTLAEVNKKHQKYPYLNIPNTTSTVDG